MFVRAVKRNFGNAVDIQYFRTQGFSPFIGNIGNHDLCASVGDKFAVHDRQSLAGLRLVGKVSGDVVFHLYPSVGNQAEYNGKNVQKEKKVPLIHDESGQFFHRRRLIFVFHKNQSFQKRMASV